MSDTSLNTIIQYGPAADRIAFVPDPAVGSKVLYIWYEDDNPPDTYVWNGAAWVLINTGGGVGDVVGPASAVNNNIAVFDTTTGKLIKDGGSTIAGAIAAAVAASGDVDGPAVAVDDSIATFNGTTGKVIQDGGGTIADVIAAAVAAAAAVTSLTGDVTGSGPGATATSIANDAVTTVKILNSNVTPAKLSNDAKTVTIGITIDGGGSVVTTGIKGYRSFPVPATIIGWRLLADIAGDVEFDIALDAFASYPPTTSIVAAAPPELVAVDSDEDTTLTGWTTAVAAGDVFGFEIVGVPATITRVTLELTLRLV